MINIKGMYKIHGLRTVQGEARSGCTAKFYETEDEALCSARRIVDEDPTCEGIVVFKAQCVVNRERPPIKIYYIGRNTYE